MTVTKTLQDIYDIAYWIIAQWQDSTAYPTTLMRSFVNKAQNNICYGNIVNLQTNERLEKQALTFLESNSFYQTYAYSTLTVSAVPGNTTIQCNNVFPTAGYLWINGDIIQYTTNDGAMISSIPTSGSLSVKFNHPGGTRVFYLHTLPTDFGQMSRAFLTFNGAYNRQQMIWIDSRDLANPVPTSYLYQYLSPNMNTIQRVGESYYTLVRWQYFFPLTGQVNPWSAISFEYQMKPTQLVNESDLVTIPDEYSLNTIPYMAVAEMMANRGEMDEAMKLQNFAFQNIKSMYQFYTTQRTELQYNQRVRTVSDWYFWF